MNNPPKGAWSDKEITALLEYVISATSREILLGRCDTFTRNRDGGAKDSGEVSGNAVRRFLWGLAVRYREYPCIEQSRSSRQRRDGLPVSYTEIYIMETLRDVDKGAMRKHWTRNCIPPPDVGYLASLFNRPTSEVEELWFQYGPNRGRKGLGVL